VHRDLAERSTELRAERVPFVHAQVILAEPPTSAQPGDEALVTGDGALFGFVGGTCAEATVRERALALLAGLGAGERGLTTVLRITPTAEQSETVHPGKQIVHNPCLSGGTIEVFLEAEVPPLLIVVAGRAPIAAALTSLGTHAGFEMRPYAGPDSLPVDTAAVVAAAHGAGEEELLVAALAAGVPYVALVASPRRGGAVVSSLPIDDDAKARVHTPAGLDIGARTPEEVALSILAEIVASRPRPHFGSQPTTSAMKAGGGSQGAFGTDPVCGMVIPVTNATLQVRHDGIDVWFCGPGCLQAFAAEPAAYRRG
jgi:xanthine dehydrogenase accessory factor